MFMKNGPDKVKMSIVIQNYVEGGMRMVGVEYFIHSFKLTWTPRLILEKNKIYEYSI